MVPVLSCTEARAAPDAATHCMSGTNTRRGVASPRVPSSKISNKYAHSRTERNELQLASWNVRSLVNVSGPIETAFVRQEYSNFKNSNLTISKKNKNIDDRRIDIVVNELKRLRIEVAGLQETRWFGEAVYSVQDSVVLSSGRKLPQKGEKFIRGEGVAIVLRGRAARAWKDGGSQWRAISPRLAVAQLRLKTNRQEICIHVVVCYAPTYRSQRCQKDEFYNDLQRLLSAVPSTDKFILLGDFNARVGSRDGDDEFSSVRGPHGFGECNESGRELLNFLSLNEATICNTWFQKRPMYKQSWQHPMTKKWHAIDFIIVHQRDRQLCTDCRVVCNADCGSDHRMVCLTLRLGQLRFPKHAKIPRRRRFDVGKLKCSPAASTDKNQKAKECVQSFQTTVSDGLSCLDESTPVDEHWKTVSSTLQRAAESTLGFKRRHQPDWFYDQQDLLLPLIDDRRVKYNKWVQSADASDEAAYKAARSRARAEVRRAKNRWLMDLAAKAEVGRKSYHGDTVWSSIRTIQKSFQGLRPSTATSIRSEDGDVCTSTEAQRDRWHEHFSRVLNIESQFDCDVLESLTPRDEDPTLAELPTAMELSRAIASLSNNKAPGESGILPEMVKFAGQQFNDALLNLIHKVWQNGSVPQAWRDAELVPIPKKGDLSRCDNWRGIALLDVVGKVVGRLVQNRLQALAEDELPESQCGFRRGRSCNDQIFSVLQLIEKQYEHRTSGFIVFIDLKKAYDSVPREALWRALRVLGVPQCLVDIIASFHTGMTTRVRVGDAHTDSIAVNNGLRQGCTISPVLFNLYFALVFEHWRKVMEQCCPDAGVDFKYNINGNLFNGPRTRHQRGSTLDVEFADDAALMVPSRATAVTALNVFHRVASSFGLTVNFAKTKFMCCGSNISPSDREPIIIDGQTVDCVASFVYLGCLMTPDARITQEVDHRIASAARAFGALRCVFEDASISVRTKRMVYTACVLSALLYGSECWPILRKDEARIDQFHHRCLRIILGVSRLDQELEHITNTDLRKRWGSNDLLSDVLRHRRLQWLGHVARMPDERLPKQLMFGWLPQTRPAHGPRLRWKDRARSDLATVQADDWFATAQDRPEWRQLCKREVPHPPRPQSVTCPVCQRTFKSRAGLTRHKCSDIRQLPVQDQPGSKQCSTCRRWFKSAGGLAVHKCSNSRKSSEKTSAAGRSKPTQPSSSLPRVSVKDLGCCAHHCNTCKRCFKSPAGFHRHNCDRGKRNTESRSEFVNICRCGRRFRWPRDLKRHICKEAT